MGLEGGGKTNWRGQSFTHFHHPRTGTEIEKQRPNLHPTGRKEENSQLTTSPPNMTSNKSERRTAVKLSMTSCFIVMVSHFKSVMDHWINATAFLNDLNILSNYNYSSSLVQVNSIMQQE